MSCQTFFAIGFGEYSSWVYTIRLFYIALLNRSDDVTMDATLRERVEVLLCLLNNMKEALETFSVLYRDWHAVRRATLASLKRLNIESLHELQRKVDIARVSGSSVRVASSGAKIVGHILAPFTFGASRALVVAGSAASVAATGTSVAARSVRVQKEQAMKQQFRKICLNDVIMTDQLLRHMNEMKQLNANVQQLIKSITTEQTALLSTYASISAPYRPSMVFVGKTVASSVAKCALHAAAPNMVPVLGIATGIIDLAVAARSIDTGSVNSTAKALTDTVKMMEKQLKHVTELHQHIKVNADVDVEEFLGRYGSSNR